MKIKNLQIDNYVFNSSKEIVIVESIMKSTNKVFLHSLDKEILEEDFIMNIEPIPITEDNLKSLLNFNYVEGEDNVYEECNISYLDKIWWLPGMYYIEKDSDQFKIYQATDEDTNWQLKWVDYIHEIQNILSALED